MYRVKIDYTTDTDWLYGSDDEWKTYVSPEFDEEVVILSNYNSDEIGEASWWEIVSNVKYALDEEGVLDPDDFVEVFREQYYAAPEIKDSQLRICARIYDTYSRPDDPDMMYELAEVLNPALNLEQGRIVGNSQGEAADVIYIAGTIDINILEDYFYGNLLEWVLYSVEYDEDVEEEYEEEIDSYLTGSSEYWNVRRDGTLEQYVRDIFNIPADEEVEIERW